MDKQTESVHYFNSFAALDRVSLDRLPNESCIQSVESLPLSTFLPDVSDCNALRSNYAILLGRLLVKKLKFFSVFKKCLPDHIPHMYSQQMSEKSVLVSTDNKM